MPKPYRSRIRLTLDVLQGIETESAQQGHVLVTRLLSLSNLTYPRLQEHLGQLRQRGWVEELDLGTRKAWRLTAAGTSALAELKRIESSLRDFGMGL